jgi:hypothetical protein
MGGQVPDGRHVWLALALWRRLHQSKIPCEGETDSAMLWDHAC